MAKTPSRKRGEAASAKGKIRAPKVPKSPKTARKGLKMASKAKSKLKNSKIGRKINAQKAKIQAERQQHIHLHRSFRRSYREDYLRTTETPGLLSHAVLTFKTIFSHWRTFLPFILLMVLLYAVIVGLMSEEVYREVGAAVDESSAELAAGEIGNFAKAGLILLSTFTTGGLDTGMDESGMMFMVMLFLIMWLVTIFLLRHFFAGEHPRLRDGLYNSLGPLLSTLVIFAIIFVQAFPLMLVAITYSAAVVTGFLGTPFYALLYFLFALSMILLSCYLFSSSIFALVAVTAPGMYPIRAMLTASDLAAGRRVRIVLRLLYLVLVIAFVFVLVMLPIILLDMWLKSMWSWISDIPIVSACLVACTCFAFIYATTYIYMYYRWLLDYPREQEAKTK